MGQSRYTKSLRAVRRIASGNAGSASSYSLRLQLNRDFLIEEHKISVDVSQAGFATTVPTSVDVRDFIDTIAVEASDGRRVFLTGAQVYDLGRFTEPSSAVVSTLAATSTASYSFDIHYANDEALLDFASALRSNELSTLDLVITFKATTSAASGFKGGAPYTGASTFAVRVESLDFAMLDSVQFGSVLGMFKHYQEKMSISGTTTGAQQDFQLITGNATRFVMLHAYDTATTVGVPTLSNAIVGNLTLNVNGRDVRVTTGFDTRQENVSGRGFNQAGVMVLDFGDDEAGWLNLNDVQQAKLQWDVLAGAPASYTVTLAQDFTRSK